MDRQVFYEKIRGEIFDRISQSQVDGIEALLNEWEAEGLTDLRQLAYILATVYHETAATMKPVKEKGGDNYLKSKKYYPYYGRDLVQTTWDYNYQKVKDFTGIDVVKNPDLISDPNIAAKVAIHFMVKGYYTGKKLSDYFNEEREDWFHARRTINGTDKAELIAGIARKFYNALS